VSVEGDPSYAVDSLCDSDGVTGKHGNLVGYETHRRVRSTGSASVTFSERRENSGKTTICILVNVHLQQDIKG
jgi:hypothetical protein